MVEEISSGPISFSSAFTSMGIHDYLFDQLGKRASKHEHSIYLLFLIDRRLKRRHSLFRVYRAILFFKNYSVFCPFIFYKKITRNRNFGKFSKGKVNKPKVLSSRIHRLNKFSPPTLYTHVHGRQGDQWRDVFTRDDV